MTDAAAFSTGVKRTSAFFFLKKRKIIFLFIQWRSIQLQSNQQIYNISRPHLRFFLPSFLPSYIHAHIYIYLYIQRESCLSLSLLYPCSTMQKVIIITHANLFPFFFFSFYVSSFFFLDFPSSSCWRGYMSCLSFKDFSVVYKTLGRVVSFSLSLSVCVRNRKNKIK